MKTPIKSFKIIKEMYEYFVKKYRVSEPKLMTCEKEDFDNVETALKEKETQDSIIKILKEVIIFDTKLPDVEINDSGNIQAIFGAVGMKIQRRMENQERDLLRKWVLETCFPKELKAIEIIKEKCPFFNLYNDEEGMCPKGHYRIYDNELYQFNELTKEEYELLKEVLK